MLTALEIRFLQVAVVVLLVLLGLSKNLTQLLIRGAVFTILMIFLLSIFLYN